MIASFSSANEFDIVPAIFNNRSLQNRTSAGDIILTTDLLVVFAHPQKEKSRVNAKIRAALTTVQKFHVHDLYDEYPNFYIDVSREQELLQEARMIVLIHPIFWYSTPALVKEWLDAVWAYGWAYGKDGDKLKSKLFLNIISTGGPEASYQIDGMHHHTIDQFLLPMQQSVKLCQMQWQTPLVFYGSNTATDDQIEIHCQEVLRVLSEYRHKCASGFADTDKHANKDAIKPVDAARIMTDGQ